MNLIRSIRLLLLMLFVLLQCVAPLAHAHVNGDNTGQSVHFDRIDSSWFSDQHHESDKHHESGTTHLSVEGHHSAVVCMPPEFRRAALVLDQPVVASKHGMLVPEVYDALVFDSFLRLNFTPLPYQHPLSQAPPV